MTAVTEQDRNKAWGFSLFADDVRQEIGGKPSIMGIYQSELLLPASAHLPLALPKLIVQVMYYELVGEITDDFSINVTYGANRNLVADVPVARQSISSPAPADLLDKDPPDDSRRILHLTFPIVLSPFAVAEAGRLRVRVIYADGKILKMGSLAIRQITDDEFQRALWRGPISSTAAPQPSEQSPPATPAT